MNTYMIKTILELYASITIEREIILQQKSKSII